MRQNIKSSLRSTLLGIGIFVLMVPMAVSAAFSRPLQVGSVGEDVKQLQEFLKQKGFFTAPNTTTFFGPLTYRALMQFQTSVGLEPVGIVGPKTRSLLNTTTSPATPLSSQGASLSRPLFIGMKGPDVVALQQFLKQQGTYTYPEITGYFGPATENAVRLFQMKHGIEPVGFIGPKTRLKIDEITTVTSNSAGQNPAAGSKANIPVTPRRGGGGGSSDAPVVVSDTTSPVISSIATGTPASTTITITWVTDEAATSRVDYGVTSSYGTASSSSTQTTSHSVKLTGLTPDTLYHYRVQSADGSGNVATSSDFTFTTASVMVTRNAVRLYGPGNATGVGRVVSNGSLSTTTAVYTNESGKPITVGSLVLSGWYLTSTGTSATGNDYTVVADIEYPIGSASTTMTVSSSSSIVVPNGTDIVTDQITLATPIPAGSSFRVNISGTIPNGEFRTTNHGITGVLSTASTTGLVSEMLFAVGDSIMANNNGAVYTACASKCPLFSSAVSGTTAQTYGTSSATNFVRQVNLARRLGATRVVSNFGTNDFGGGTSLANLQSYLTNMKNLTQAENILFTQATMLPRVTAVGAITASSLTASGTTMTATVPDASMFVVGKPYIVAGAVQTEYNGNRIATAVDTDADTVSFLFVGTSTTPATGTITLGTWKATSVYEFQAPYSVNPTAYAFTSTSTRSQFNTWVRGGNFDGYIDWADAVEVARDNGRWKIGGDSSLLVAPQTVTVTSGLTTATRFQTTYSGGSSTMANGFAVFTSGANIGESRNASNNTGGDYTSGTAFSTIPVISDSLVMVPGTSYASDDGLHPRVAQGGKGGQQLLVDSTITWIDSILE